MKYYAKTNQLGSGNTVPEDSIEVTEQQYKNLLEQAMQGNPILLDNESIISLDRNTKYAIVDEENFYVKMEQPSNDNLNTIINQTNPPPENLIKPKYENNSWVEGATVEEINASNTSKLEAYKLQKINELKELNKSQIEAGVPWDGDTYELKEHDQLNIMAAFQTAQVNPSIVVKPSFRNADGGKVVKTLDASQIGDLYMLFVNHVGACKEAFNLSEEGILNAETIEEIDSFYNNYN